ncbi:hypothetical protein BaRGS_00020898 [Batillaria attramentaria]|uniref:C-type lectin domain-containing protein n=1 Tax=Batillaria attramentaria TaxID=370345 RepID=A0ABD0KLH5_9CAEN
MFTGQGTRLLILCLLGKFSHSFLQNSISLNVQLGSSSACTADQADFTWVYLDCLYYWISTGTVTNYDNARCICSAQEGNVNLAVLNTSVSSVVGSYLADNHPEIDFWVDARMLSGEYVWATGEPLSGDSWAWSEPSHGDTHVWVKATLGLTRFYGTNASSLARPLCQSTTPPSAFGPSPQPFTWVTFSNPDQTFGFSGSRSSLAAAHHACARQPGHLHLATLDEHFEEVTQYILDNHLTRNYWVDAVRDDPLLGHFVWGNSGLAVNSSVLNPGISHTVAALEWNQNDLRLTSRGDSTIEDFFICEGNPETSGASFEWVSLGASNDLFGFSLTVSEGYDWAKAACEKEAGDVRLATLATMFQEVTQYISQNYNDREFWVDATRPDTDQVFHWADGTAVNDSMWTADGLEPGLLDKWSRITLRFGHTLLAGISVSTTPYYFICQGTPAAVMGTENGLGCPEITTPQTSTEPATTDATTTRTASPTQVSTDEITTRTASPTEVFTDDITTRTASPTQVSTDEITTRTASPTEVSTDEITTRTASPTQVSTDEITTRTASPTQVSTDEITTRTASPTEVSTDEITTRTASPTEVSTDDITTRTASPTEVSTDEITTRTASPTEVAAEGLQPITADLSTTLDRVCKCRCAPDTLLYSGNVSMAALLEEVKRKMKSAQDNLLLDKANLSATIRAKTSAKDSRPSAQATGALGIVMLSVVFGALLLPDLVSFVRVLVNIVRNCQAGSGQNRAVQRDTVE